MNEKRKTAIPAMGWLIVILAWAVLLLGHFGNNAFGFVLPAMSEDLSLSAAMSGNLSAAGWLATAILTIPITFLVIRMSPKKVLGIVFLAVGIGSLGMSFSNSYAMLIISRAVGVGVVVAIQPALVPLKTQWIPASRIGDVNAIENFMNPAGLLVASFLPNILLAIGGWRGTYRILGIICILLAIVWFITAQEKTEGIVKNEQTTGQGESPFIGALKQRAVLLFGLAIMGACIPYSAILTFWPTFAVENLGLTLAQAGLILGVFPVAAIIASLTSQKIADVIGYDKPLIWLWGIVTPLGYLGMLQISNITILLVIAAITGFAAFSFMPIGLTTLYKIPDVDPGVVSMGTGIVLTLMTLGGAIGGAISGAWIDAMGMFNALRLISFFAATLFIFGIFMPEYGRKYEEKKEN